MRRIDDHSRLIVRARFAFAENSFALAAVIKSHFAVRTSPELYCDNGAAFSTAISVGLCSNGHCLLH